MDVPEKSRRTFLKQAAVAAPVLAQLLAARGAFADQLVAASAPLPERLKDALPISPSILVINSFSFFLALAKPFTVSVKTILLSLKFGALASLTL